MECCFNGTFLKWNIINDDKDDNKFIDCYLVLNSDIFVSNDKHFNFFKNIDFLRVNVIKIDKFKEIFFSRFSSGEKNEKKLA